MRWIGFPHIELEVFGLPWFERNAPDLSRLPIDLRDNLPPKVRGSMCFAGGGRIRFCSDTSCLSVRMAIINPRSKIHQNLDLYADETYWTSIACNIPGFAESSCFEHAGRKLT